jgi:hypothetical protein
MDNAQKLTLRTHIQANTTQLPFGGGTAAINATFNAAFLNAGDAQLIADWYNLVASPDHWVVRVDASVGAIRNAILWNRYTPAPTISGANAAQHTACSNACMGKQTVLQSLLGLTAAGLFDATRATQTSGLKDATTALPSAGSFANQDAGWVPVGGSSGVSNELVRKCTNLEKVFALNQGIPALNDGSTARGGWNTGTGLGNPDITALYGETVTGNDISDIKGLPA